MWSHVFVLLPSPPRSTGHVNPVASGGEGLGVRGRSLGIRLLVDQGFNILQYLRRVSQSHWNSLSPLTPSPSPPKIRLEPNRMDGCLVRIFGGEGSQCEGAIESVFSWCKNLSSINCLSTDDSPVRSHGPTAGQRLAAECSLCSQAILTAVCACVEISVRQCCSC